MIELDDMRLFRALGGSRSLAAKGITVRLSGALSSNDGTVISDWAADGLGIIERSEWSAAGLIAAGKPGAGAARLATGARTNHGAAALASRRNQSSEAVPRSGETCVRIATVAPAQGG